MSRDASPAQPLATIERLQASINTHDLEALVACFTDGHVSEHPSHPDRSFTGVEQVRRNWTQILGGVPDLVAHLVSSSVDGNRVWCEWDWSGTRRDGAPHRMRGVTITTVVNGRISETRFYMEPVVADGVPVDAVVRQTVAAGASEKGR